MVSVDEVRGLWRRTLIVLPDGSRDATTFVAWMQSQRHFVDLRQPEGRPSFADVATLRDLTWPQVAWMARQEGFAGDLVHDGRFVEWRRRLDFQPQSGRPDSARLWFEGSTLIEEGRDVAYVEHWAPEHAAAHATSAMWLREAGGARQAALVRCDDRFMLMTGRAAPLPPGVSLAAIVADASSLAAAQDVVDCEISLGRVGRDGWRVERSSLPFREGDVMVPHYASAERWSRGLQGEPGAAAWEIVEAQGDAAARVAR